MRGLLIFAATLAALSWFSQGIAPTNKTAKASDPSAASIQPSQPKSADPVLPDPVAPNPVSPSATTTTASPNPQQPAAPVKPDASQVFKVDVVRQAPDWWSRAYVFIAALLAAVGIGTLMMLYVQTRASHNAERARVDLILTVFGLAAYNFGKSAATLTSYELTHSSFLRGTKDFRGAPVKHEQLAGQKIMQHILIPTLPVADSKTAPNLSTVDLRHYISDRETSGDHIAIFTATVSYRDIFEKPHLTRIMYRYSPSSLSLKFLAEYTEYS